MRTKIDVTRDIADIRLWPTSTTPFAATIDESDDIRLSDDDLDPIAESRSFAAEWCRGECPEIDLPDPRHDSEKLITESPVDFEDEYEMMKLDFGEMWTPEEVAEYLYEKVEEQASHLWTDEDEEALRELNALYAYEMDDDEDDTVVDEWTEWLVLAGELERIDTATDTASAVWAWCPDHRAEVPGSDEPMDSMDDAKRIFDAYDPMGLWFTKRHAEVLAGEEPKMWRRMEIDLVCQTCVRDSSGLISVRDDSVRLSKQFDIDGDTAAQTLMSSILAHI